MYHSIIIAAPLELHPSSAIYRSLSFTAPCLDCAIVACSFLSLLPTQSRKIGHDTTIRQKPDQLKALARPATARVYPYRTAVLVALAAAAVSIWLMPPSLHTYRSLALATLRRRTWQQQASAASSIAARSASTSRPTSNLRLLDTAVRARMVHTAGAIPVAADNRSASQKNGYATMADIMSSYTSMDPPPSPYAPSLSHLNPTTLPPGYEKPSPDATYSVFLPSIDKSTNDDRAYRLIRLDNGLECMLVSDPKTDKSAAGISVRVGHLSDPENAQGMAHFCEHLLFMGTEKVCVAFLWLSLVICY